MEENLNTISNELKNQDRGESNQLKYIIIALVVLIAIIGIILVIIFSQKSSSKEIFGATITNLREQFNSLNSQLNQEVTSDKMMIENHISFNTDIEELSIFNDYKLDTTLEIDQTNNYFNLMNSISNNDKRIIDMIIYMIDNTIFFESSDLFDRSIELTNITQNNEINITVTKDDIFYLIDKSLEYFNDSLIDNKFTQNNEEITIDNETVNVIANKYLIDNDTYQAMANTFKSKILNDDKYIDVLANISGVSEQEIIDNLNEKTSIGNINETVGLSEANMIYSGINNYCATSKMKAQLDPNYIDICADGVTKEEVATMINLGNAKIVEISYTDKIENLIINSNGYTYTLQNDGSFSTTKDVQEISDIIITIYTNKKDELIGFKLTEQEETLINYTIYNDSEKFEIYLDDINTIKGQSINDVTDISFFENEEEILNINFKITENNLDFNIDTPNAKDYLGIGFKQTNELINENETKYKQNIIFYFGNETNPYSIELINDATLYYNADIIIKEPNNIITVDQLTENDIVTILNNLQKRLENTVFESFLDLFMINNN